MTDKGHYHSYNMDTDPPEDPPASRSSAPSLPVEQIGTGQLPALLAPDPDAADIETQIAATTSTPPAAANTSATAPNPKSPS